MLEERKRISDDENDDLSTGLNVVAPDQKCITHYPPIKRGREYTSYFRNAGTLVFLNI